jgi:hypothetical protein
MESEHVNVKKGINILRQRPLRRDRVREEIARDGGAIASVG